MKTKFNFILIALCLIVFCFMGNVHASERISEDDFLQNYVPLKLSDFSYPYKGYIAVRVDEFRYRLHVLYGNYESLDFIKPLVVDSTSSDYSYKIYLPVLSDKYFCKTFDFFPYDANPWIESTTKTIDPKTGSGLYLDDFSTVLDSSYIIYKGDSPFFPQAPTVVAPLEEVKLEELGEKITGTMGTITITAVSCLVLLILLPLFWKALFRFL